MKDFKNRYPISLDSIDVAGEVKMGGLPGVPVTPAKAYIPGFFGGLMPLEFTGTRDETIAWHETCSLCAVLNPTPRVRVKGPQAIDFMRKNFVNNVDNWPIGASKHGLMLLEDSTIAAQGVILRIDEDEYEANWLSPFFEYRFSCEEYDAELIDLTDKMFMFQMQGPESTAILEEVTGGEVSDLKFCRSKMMQIDGVDVRVLRFGMGGTLGYEVHGPVEAGPAIYKRIVEAGNPRGIRQMGYLAYTQNHVAGGSQQAGTHFLLSCDTDPGYRAFCGMPESDEAVQEIEGVGFALNGSMEGTDPSNRFANPIEIGARRCVNFNHDFIGKEALLEYEKAPKRTMKTLVWNPEDLADIYLSQFTDTPYRQMDDWAEPIMEFGGWSTAIDWVQDAEGNKIGFTGGRRMDWYHHDMISLAVMDLEFCEDGTEVQVLWGEPDTRQKLIRATVAPMPYNTHLSNRTTDVKQL